MDRLWKSVIAAILVATLLIGIHQAVEFDSDGASLFSLPEITLFSDSDSDDIRQSADRDDSESVNTGRMGIGTLHEFNDAIVAITEQANPTVVTITTHRTVRQRFQSPFSFFFDDPRFDREREFQREGLGSGVIISGDGYIMTNNHVIHEADEILVRTYEGQEYDAEVVGADPESDVAILRIETEGLPAISLGDSDELRVGELVLAIGSPLHRDLANTVSMGVVSAKGRAHLGLSAYENYIQTDAAINPGNSGGPLINMNGELIGINTAIASRTGGHQGIGFAIPINMARMVMESILEDGRVVRSFLGIHQGAMVDRVMARALELDVNYGVVIGQVTPDSPAERAGLAEGDVLLRKDGSPIRDWYQFRLSIANAEPGTEVEFEVFRDGERRTITVVLDERPSEEVAAVVPDQQREEMMENLGFRVDDLTDNVRRQLNLDDSVEGVVVAEIQRGSRAERQGLQRGDVITQVHNQRVTSPDEFYNAVSGLYNAGQDVMLLRVNRGGVGLFIAVEL